MATKAGLVQVKDLIKQDKLSTITDYCQGITTKKGKAGFYRLIVSEQTNRVWFMVRLFENDYYSVYDTVNRNKTLAELREMAENC